MSLPQLSQLKPLAQGPELVMDKKCLQISLTPPPISQGFLSTGLSDTSGVARTRDVGSTHLELLGSTAIWLWPLASTVRAG